MVETVLTTSAMWLFDVAKNVTSSTVPEKKKISKLSEAHKARVTVTFVKEQDIRVPVHTVSTGLHVVFGCSPLIKQKLTGLSGNFPVFKIRILQTQ